MNCAWKSPTTSLGAPEGAGQAPKDALLWQLCGAAINAERKELIRQWRGNEISVEVTRHQEEIMDYQEAPL
jgi:monovalent cation/hydrogen antiporter